MSPEETETRVRRILVALDASADSLSALEAAADLAAALEAELRGLFVEEERLFRLAKHPLAEEVSLFGRAPRRLESRDLERQLRALANRAREWMRHIAEQRRVEWSFRTVRGRVAAEILTACAEADLVSLGVSGRSVRRRPGSTVRALIRQGSRPVLILPRNARLGRRIHVLHDGSDASERAFRLAARIAGRLDARLTVFLVPCEGRTPEEIRARAADDAEEAGVLVEYRALRGRTPSEVVAALPPGAVGLSVVPRTCVADLSALDRILEWVSCPLLLAG